MSSWAWTSGVSSATSRRRTTEGLVVRAESEKSPEIGVSGDHDLVVVDGPLEDLVIIRGMQVMIGDMGGVEPEAAEFRSVV